MLAQLTISNFAIVRELEIDFHSGMTAITGETGAGKSIAIDALGLCLGGRAEADMVRRGATRADLCARFALKDTPAAQRWLEENQLESGRECLLRRVISADGRSRGFINGTAVPLSQLRELGQLLIQIHGQHAHQLLTKPEHQKTLLDGYTGEYALTQRMAEHYRQWHQSCRELAQHQQQSQERAARADLLRRHDIALRVLPVHPQADDPVRGQAILIVEAGLDEVELLVAAVAIGVELVLVAVDIPRIAEAPGEEIRGAAQDVRVGDGGRRDLEVDAVVQEAAAGVVVVLRVLVMLVVDAEIEEIVQKILSESKR